MRHALVAVLSMVAVLGAAGCAESLTPAGPPLPYDVNGAALDPVAPARWSDFPVDARPGPIVIDELPARSRDSTEEDGETYDLAAPLPPDPASTVDVVLPGGRFRLGTVTARQAFDALAQSARSQATQPGSRARVTAVAFGTAVFGTDRGGRVLPAWLFTVDGNPDPLAWPAITSTAFRRVDVVHGSRLSADGRTVIVAMPAGPDEDGGCPGSTRVRWLPVTLESHTAVDVGLRAVADGTVPGTPQPMCGYCPGCATGMGQLNAVYRIPLGAPLGNRVLLGQVGLNDTVVLSVDPE